jgi:MFS family permease
MTTDTSRLRSGWVWLLALFTSASFVEAMVFGQLGAFIPLYLPHLGIPQSAVPAWTGALAAITGAIGIPFLPFWGALADRYARQPIIVRSFVVELCAVLLMMMAGGIWFFMIGRSLTALALGNTGLMLTTLSERAARNRLGLAFSIMNSAAPIGAFLGPLLGGPLVDTRGFNVLLLVDAFFLSAVVLGTSFGYRDHFQGTNRGPLVSMAAESVRIIGRSARLRTLFPALFLLCAGWTLAMTYVPLVIKDLYTGEDLGTVVGTVIGIGGLATLLISPLLGALADRFGHWRVLFIGASVAVLLWPIPLFVHGLTEFTIAWALIAGVVAAVFALSFTLLSTSSPSAVRGRVMAFAFLPFNLAFTFGPAVGSVITRSSVFTIFPVAALSTALGIAVLWYARKQPVEGEL